MPGKGKGEFNMGFYKVHSATILGLKVEFVQVEADAGNGLPMFHMVGYLSSEVKEAAERVRTAMRNAGYTMPAKKIVINLSPACVRKKGSVFDLPIAVAVLGAMGIFPEKAVEDIFTCRRARTGWKAAAGRGNPSDCSGSKEGWF